MRHQKKGRKINSNTGKRKALFKGLLLALFNYEEIQTTLVKGKMVKRMADSLVSKAQKGNLSVRKQILAFLPDKKIANKLIDEIAPRFKSISGGFTRLVRIGHRRGDNAMIAKVELIKKKKEEIKTLKQEDIKTRKQKIKEKTKE